MRNTQKENLQEHSMQVAVIAHALALFRNTYFTDSPALNADKIAVRALFHDVSETITGDMPTPVKYANPEIKKAYKDLEEIACTRLLAKLPDGLQNEYAGLMDEDRFEPECLKFIKAADRLSAYIKCVEEIKAGNNEFKKAGETILLSIEKLGMPEVQMFLDEHMKAYEMSLDEI